MSQLRNQLWSNFCNEKFKSYYLNVINAQLRHIDLALNFVVAFATTASVASWAIWEAVPYLWIAIVGISQVVIVAKPFAPYLRDYRTLTELELDHETAAFEYEKLFVQFDRAAANGKKAEAAFQEEVMKVREAISERRKRFSELNVRKSKKVEETARQKRNTYLSINYGVKI